MVGHSCILNPKNVSGLNDFEDCDVGLACRVSYKNVSALEDDARTILDGDEITRETVV